MSVKSEPVKHPVGRVAALVAPLPFLAAVVWLYLAYWSRRHAFTHDHVDGWIAAAGLLAGFGCAFLTLWAARTRRVSLGGSCLVCLLPWFVSGVLAYLQIAQAGAALGDGMLAGLDEDLRPLLFGGAISRAGLLLTLGATTSAVLFASLGVALAFSSISAADRPRLTVAGLFSSVPLLLCLAFVCSFWRGTAVLTVVCGVVVVLVSSFNGAREPSQVSPNERIPSALLLLALAVLLSFHSIYTWNWGAVGGYGPSHVPLRAYWLHAALDTGSLMALVATAFLPLGLVLHRAALSGRRILARYLPAVAVTVVAVAVTPIMERVATDASVEVKEHPWSQVPSFRPVRLEEWPREASRVDAVAATEGVFVGAQSRIEYSEHERLQRAFEEAVGERGKPELVLALDRGLSSGTLRQLLTIASDSGAVVVEIVGLRGTPAELERAASMFRLRMKAPAGASVVLAASLPSERPSGRYEQRRLPDPMPAHQMVEEPGRRDDPSLQLSIWREADAERRQWQSHPENNARDLFAQLRRTLEAEGVYGDGPVAMVDIAGFGPPELARLAAEGDQLTVVFYGANPQTQLARSSER